MNCRIIGHGLIWVMLLLITLGGSSCKKANQVTSEEEAQNKIAKSELQMTSKAYNVLAILDGAYYKQPCQN